MKYSQGIAASRQGEHDYLCSIYSLINSLYYLYDGRPRRSRIMYHLLRSYSERWDLFDLMTIGLDEEQMDYLINDTLKNGYYAYHYPIHVRTPFRSKHLHSKKIFHIISNWLQPAENKTRRVVILGTTWHWTVVVSTDENRLYLFDSLGIKSQRKDTFSVRVGIKRHTLIPDAIYFIERKS